MFVARLEIVPFGDREHTREIGEVRICQLDVNENGVGEYLATVHTTDDTRKGPVLFHHRRNDGALECLRRATDAFMWPAACTWEKKTAAKLSEESRENMGLGDG